jgi:hypothetical protein
MMIWKKVKKVIIPLIIAKFIIFGIIIFSGDFISISRDINCSSNYQKGLDKDSSLTEKQKFIRIVRNDEEHRISIILRGKKNSKPLVNKEMDLSHPMVD